MAQRSSTRAFAKAVDGMMAIGFVAGDKPSTWTNLLSTVTEWTG
jgi:hypothetical protein